MTADLVLSLCIPDASDADDPDEWADRVADALNIALGHTSRRECVMVSLIPSPQWLTAKWAENMRSIGTAVASLSGRPSDG